MNVSGQHLLAVEHIQCASMYQAASAVSVDLDSTITPVFVSVGICVYVSPHIVNIIHVRAIFAIKDFCVCVNNLIFIK